MHILGRRSKDNSYLDALAVYSPCSVLSKVFMSIGTPLFASGAVIDQSNISFKFGSGCIFLGCLFKIISECAFKEATKPENLRQISVALSGANFIGRYIDEFGFENVYILPTGRRMGLPLRFDQARRRFYNSELT